MQDTYGREITYLRVSVTDRCNLRCQYCMPADGVDLSQREEILSLEEIAVIIDSAALAGIKRIRLTGGEPLVRKGIVDLVQWIHEMPGIEEIAMTTNGILLPDFASSLKKAGLTRVNISLDTMKEDKYATITRGGQLSKVWLGIESALDIGFEPVKINVVGVKGFNDDEFLDFAELTKKMPLHIRFIELMPIGVGENVALGEYVSTTEMKELIETKYQLESMDSMQGLGPAVYYRIPGARGTIGFISAMSQHFCATCNRIRLTADGKIRPCLCATNEIDLKPALRGGIDKEQLACLITNSLTEKPKEHQLLAQGWTGNNRIMNQIGG